MGLELYYNLIDILSSGNKNELDKLFNSTYWVDIAVVLKKFDDNKLLQFYEFVGNENMAKVTYFN